MLRNASFVIAPQGLLLAALGLPHGPAAWGAAAVWVVSQACLMHALLHPRSRLLGQNTWRVLPQPRIALTFDDGPHPEDTPAILDTLARAGARATVVFLGGRARRHPDLVLRAAAAGHEIGVHSDTHPWWFSVAGPARLRREVNDAARSLEEISGRRPRHFRPPMGHKNIFLDDAVRAAGLHLVTWSVRALDTFGRKPERIQRAVMRRAAPGGIVVLHEGVRRPPGGPSPTVAALGGVIRALRERGLDPVSLEDLRRGPQTADRRPGSAASI